MKKKRKIKVPAAVFGIETGDSLGVSAGKIAGGVGDSVGQLGALASLFLGHSNAVNSGDVVKESLMGVASGISTGAKIGTTIGGPVGAAIGAAGGAVVGAIGKKGKKAEMTSFTDYDEGTLSTGMRAIGGANKRRRRERTRVKLNAYGNRAAVQGTEDMASDYAEDYGNMDTYTFEYGGATPSSLAYVDDGELIQTPDGSVGQIPEQGQPVDSNLMNLPSGTKILSNTLKVPGTSKTFSELGEKMMSKKKSNNNDRFAQNASKLNEMNNKSIHDQLFTLQEITKQSKGIKNKSKSVDAESFYNGGKTKEYAFDNSIPTNLGDIVADYVYNPNRKWGAATQFGGENDQWYHVNTNKVQQSGAQSALQETQTSTSKPASTLKTKTAKQAAVTPEEQSKQDAIKLNLQKGLQQDVANFKKNTPWSTKITERPTSLVKRKEVINPPKSRGVGEFMNGLGKLGTGLATMAPIFSNIMTKNEQPVQANYNPYANAISRTMRGRKFDIDPVLQEISRNRAISNYNTSQMNTNTGANLAYRLQAALNEDRTASSLYSQKSNTDMQYAADYANTLNSLGQQWVGATNLASDLNSQNRANTRNIRRAGLSQLSQYLQNESLMGNQASRDDAMMQLYAPFLQAGFSTQDVANLTKYLRKGGNNVG